MGLIGLIMAYFGGLEGTKSTDHPSIGVSRAQMTVRSLKLGKNFGLSATVSERFLIRGVPLKAEVEVFCLAPSNGCVQP